MQVIKIFEELSQIPRCSHYRDRFVEYLKDFAKKYDYQCVVDKAQNVLISKRSNKANICLQSHYDMVCLGDEDILKDFVPMVYEENGYLKAQKSTLGADNGIGCAYMLSLIKDGANIEALFTSDEEIGLIGANNLELEIKSNKILNLDSEEEGKIFIGCAGGADIKAKFDLICSQTYKYYYEIEVIELQGGHSGVDIDKNIPNAIKVLANYIQKNSCNIVSIEAGERINSIPKFAKAIVGVDETIKPNQSINIKRLEMTYEYCIDKRFHQFLYTFSTGVRGYDSELGSVLSSINLALVYKQDSSLIVELSARSMDNDELESLSDETKILLECFGFNDLEISGKYKPWKPVKNNKFSLDIKKAYEKYFVNQTISYEAIHAGLECAVLKDIYPHIDIVSIGPNIYFPHSFNEEVEISSIQKVYEVVKEIVKV